jgi:hypothetical protein
VQKVGRNDPCPCRSGKKYKRCCLLTREQESRTGGTQGSSVPHEVRQELIRRTLLQARWVEKYGHVRPPIAAKHAGQTFVAVGSRLLYDPRWKTFHDFLFTYIGSVFEKDWFKDELTKPLEERHPLMQWYDLLHQFQKTHHHEHAEGEIVHVPAPPAQISALLSFAYDLYTLEHHSLLPQRLVARLNRKDQFQGARYETYVASAFVRAGYDITLEDESDQSTSHCEFSAVHRDTGSTYSIEAKSRHRSGFLGQAGRPQNLGEIEASISGLLVPALRKEAKHDRVVFIDVNVPPEDCTIFEAEWFKKLASQLKRLEDKPPPGPALPSAFVFLTNFPYHFVGRDEPLSGSAAFFTGFNVPDFRRGDPALVSASYPAIVVLFESVLRHTRVPHDLPLQ